MLKRTLADLVAALYLVAATLAVAYGMQPYDRLSVPEIVCGGFFIGACSRPAVNALGGSYEGP